MKNKMVTKMMMGFGVVLLLFSLIVGSIFVVLFREHTIDINRVSMEENAISIASNISKLMGNGKGMGRRSEGGYGAYLKFIDQIAMGEIWIVDENLNLLSLRHGEQLLTYNQLPINAETVVNRVFEGEITYGEEFSDFLEVPSLTVGAPIYDDSKVVGVVLLHSPVSWVEESIYSGIYTLVIGLIVALILAGLFASFVSYKLTRPLVKMKNAAYELSQGNYKARTGIFQNDELGQLAETIDYLSEKLSLAKKEQEEIDSLKKNLIGNVSHELRTPVAVIRGSLEVLKDDTVHNDDEVKEYYEYMLKESIHLERLVNDLLELSKLQDEGFKLEFNEVNLCDVIKDVSRSLRLTLKEKNINLELVYPKEECVVQGDYGRLRQLVIILMDNAIKFSYEKSTIKLKLEKNKNYELSVEDCGEDIPSEQLPYIFERFQKSISDKNMTGTGLGLAIAKEIVIRHNAKIEIKSEGGITCFTVKF